MGRRGLTLEPQRLLRSQRVDSGEDARAPEPFQDVFWWSGVGQDTATPNNDPSAFIKLVFGSDTELERIETVVGMYRALFDACDVPQSTRRMILGGTMSQFLKLPA